jgi:hypothetical protein
VIQENRLTLRPTRWLNHCKACTGSSAFHSLTLSKVRPSDNFAASPLTLDPEAGLLLRTCTKRTVLSQEKAKTGSVVPLALGNQARAPQDPPPSDSGRTRRHQVLGLGFKPAMISLVGVRRATSECLSDT